MKSYIIPLALLALLGCTDSEPAFESRLGKYGFEVGRPLHECEFEAREYGMWPVDSATVHGLFEKKYKSDYFGEIEIVATPRARRICKVVHVDDGGLDEYQRRIALYEDGGLVVEDSANREKHPMTIRTTRLVDTLNNDMASVTLVTIGVPNVKIRPILRTELTNEGYQDYIIDNKINN